MNHSAIIGPAGSGKSTAIRERAAGDPNYAKVCATTGIAAVNLGPGVTTVNSVLGFYDTASAKEALESGQMTKRFVALAAQGFKNLVIDEVSMMPAATLDCITQAANNAEQQIHAAHSRNEFTGVLPVNVLLTGDFLQLPPVSGRFVFNAPAWKEFEQNIQRLTTIYRQSNPEFLEALNAARVGKGISAAQKLKSCGVQFVAARDDFFEGATLVPTNAIAESINASRFAEIGEPVFCYPSYRWGVEQSEWKDIPQVLEMKQGAWVTILANEPGTFTFVNGDQGEIVSMDDETCTIEILRGSQRKQAVVPYVWRETVQRVKPDGAAEYVGFLLRETGTFFKSVKDIREYVKDIESEERRDRMRRVLTAQFLSAYDAYAQDCIDAGQPFWSSDKQRWVVGWIKYMPIRLGWASTIHKVQGLTLDHIQIDSRSAWKKQGHWCGAAAPGMMYVALSRCRNPENIRVVGSGLGSFAERINAAKECLQWA